MYGVGGIFGDPPIGTDVSAPAVKWLFHSTAMVEDYDLACRQLSLLAGLSVLEYGENLQPEIGRRGGMTWIGDNSIEIGQPIVDSGGAAKFLRRSGGGMHSIAVQVEDIDATIRHVESCGVAVAARPMPEFFFTNPHDTDGVFTEWGAFELDVDPHFGADVPPSPVVPILSGVRHAFVGAVVTDPFATGAKFARLFGTEITFEHRGAAAGEVAVGVSAGDCTLALFAMPGTSSERLWGRTYDKPRTHLLGISVDDLDQADALLASHQFSVVRRTDSMIVVDPASTGGVQVAIVRDLLPGDPRL